MGFQMSKAVTLPPPGFDELSSDEKLDYVLSLWDRVAAAPESVPTPHWHRQIVEQRLNAHRENPDAAKPWSEVRAGIEKRLRRR